MASRRGHAPTNRKYKEINRKKSSNSQLNNSQSQAKPRIIPNSKLKTPNSSALPPKTIFAFLTLNTPRSAHNKIFGAKFLSFERLELMCLNTACYEVFWRSAMKSDSQTSRFLLR